MIIRSLTCVRDDVGGVRDDVEDICDYVWAFRMNFGLWVSI